MIFVTVGTHEQQFNRLIGAIDTLSGSGSLRDSVLIQTGYSDYIPTHCEWTKFVAATDMKRLMTDADVVVTHGGPSSFLEAMAVGKKPVVVPRRAEYNEHVNNHQVEFVRLVSERRGGIIPVFEICDLLSAVESARRSSIDGIYRSHNAAFCADLAKRISAL